jgi:hypothetical protein
MSRAMTAYREQRNAYLIEAGAVDLHHGAHWKPWLRLSRCAGGDCASDTFDRLKPVFGAEQVALEYAAELGRSLVDEALARDPGSPDRNTAIPRDHLEFEQPQTATAANGRAQGDV